MPGKDARAQEKMNGNRTAQPARKRTVMPNFDFSIEDIPEGTKAMVFRLEAPYERYDFPVDAEALERIVGICRGSSIVVPDIIPPNLTG